MLVQKEQPEPEPPDLLSPLLRHRWLTPANQRSIYDSIRLALLRDKMPFVFEYSGGHGEWPPEYKEMCLSVYESWQSALQDYKHKASINKWKRYQTQEHPLDKLKPKLTEAEIAERQQSRAGATKVLSAFLTRSSTKKEESN